MDFTFRVLHWCCYCRCKSKREGNVWKVQFLKCQSGQFSCSVLMLSKLAFSKLLFFAMIFQSWLVLKAAVTGLGHTVFFLFIGVKEVFMLHNSPICISSVYRPSALKIQPASSKAQNSVLILNEGEEKTVTHTLLYILHLRWHPIRQRSLMWQKLDTFFKKRRPKIE